MTRQLIVFTILCLMLTPSGFAQAEEDRPRDTFYDAGPRHETVRKPVELTYVREADVLWSKRIWQVIDMREPINQFLYYPERPAGEFRSLMQVLMDAILDGKIRAYGVDDESFENNPLDPEKLFREDLSQTQTFFVDGVEEVVEIPFDPSNVMVMRIKEDWFIDSRRGRADVRIIGLSPAMLVRDDETGEFTDIQDPLFWVPFEETREVLANAIVYNPNNRSQRVSMDDFFIRRLFNSTVYREERPDNRVIMEYIEDPTERLLEAQRIIDEIRNMELDLWHY